MPCPRRLRLPLFLLFLPIALCGMAQKDSTLLAQADTLLVHGELKSAAKLYQRLTERPAVAAEAYRGLAVCAQKRGAPNAEVIEHMNRSLALAPTDHHLLRCRANIYTSIQMYDRAYADLEQALRTVPNDSLRAEYMADQGWALINTRRFGDAHALLLKAYAVDSTCGSVVNDLGLVAEDLGDVDGCIRWMKKFIALDTTDAVGYGNMGFMLSNHDRYQEALAYFDTAATRGFNNDGRLFNNRGYAKLKLGDTHGALADIKHSLELFPGNAYAYRNLGLTYQAMGRHDDACTAFEQALELGYTKRFGDDVRKNYDASCH